MFCKDVTLNSKLLSIQSIDQLLYYNSGQWLLLYIVGGASFALQGGGSANMGAGHVAVKSTQSVLQYHGKLHPGRQTSHVQGGRKEIDLS